MEVDVLKFEKLINRTELAVVEEKCTLNELKRLLRQKETEAVTLERLIKGLKGRKLNGEGKRLLEKEIGKLELVRKDIKRLKGHIGYWEERLKKDEQILNRWNEKVESTKN